MINLPEMQRIDYNTVNCWLTLSGTGPWTLLKCMFAQTVIAMQTLPECLTALSTRPSSQSHDASVKFIIWQFLCHITEM